MTRGDLYSSEFLNIYRICEAVEHYGDVRTKIQREGGEDGHGAEKAHGLGRGCKRFPKKPPALSKLPRRWDA